MISTVADLYIVLYNSIVLRPITGHGRQGYYFGENGEYTHYEAKAVAEALVDKRLGKTLARPKNTNIAHLRFVDLMTKFSNASKKYIIVRLL